MAFEQALPGVARHFGPVGVLLLDEVRYNASMARLMLGVPSVLSSRTFSTKEMLRCANLH